MGEGGDTGLQNNGKQVKQEERVEDEEPREKSQKMRKSAGKNGIVKEK